MSRPQMTEQEKQELIIEKISYQEVIRQMSKGDARMEISLNEFLCGIEEKIREIDRKLNGA